MWGPVHAWPRKNEWRWQLDVVAFFFNFFSHDDDSVAHFGHRGLFRVALILVPGFFVHLHIHQLAHGRFDFDMGRVNRRNRPEHMLVGAEGKVRRKHERHMNVTIRRNHMVDPLSYYRRR